MAIKTFYNTPTNSSNQIYGPSLDTLYESGGGFGFYSKDGDTTVIPLGSTINSVTFRLWMHYDSGLENKMRFCYLADYDNCSKSSSTDKYYYVGSSVQHHGNGNEYLKYFTFVSSASGKNHATDPSLKHNYEVTIYPKTNQEDGLTDKNIAYLTSKYFNVTKVSANQIRCYSGKSYKCYGIEMDINYSPPAVTPGNPTFTYPAAESRTTYNTKPWFRFKSGTNATKFYYRVDTASWQNFSCNASTTYDKQWPTELSTGSHTLYIYNTSSTDTVNPAGKTGTSRAFTVATPQAAVSAGNTIDDVTIDGLQTNIRNQQYYYGQTQTTFTTCDSGTIILDDHIDALETAIEALPHPTSLTSVNAGDFITLATFNNIRSALLNA